MENIFIGTIVVLSVVVLLLFNNQRKLMRMHEDEKNEIRKNTENILNESQKEISATVTENYNMLKKENNHELQKLKKDYDTELTNMKKYIGNLEKFSRNRGEILAHEILMDLKSNLLEEGIINRNEMIIMGNVFIPFRYKDNEDLKSRQIDHLILLPQGIYIIETKYWKGKILQGISKKNADNLSILLDNLFPGIKDDMEKTLILNPIKENEGSNEFRVISYDNPVNQVRQTAVKLNQYIKEKINKNIGINSLVYFGYYQDKNNFVEIYGKQQGNFPTLICKGEKELKDILREKIEKCERKYNVEELLEIQELLNEYNRIS
ncbi:nuclease-related domain-containing protein [Lysinibacillus sp. NPDC093197]|uniref:nuclease-related domain-containing protein n=1 Tax=Lysinibacillus sp. NPDC093197 TaxID=3364132 RepID=UPI003822CC59